MGSSSSRGLRPQASAPGTWPRGTARRCRQSSLRDQLLILDDPAAHRRAGEDVDRKVMSPLRDRFDGTYFPIRQRR
jgi:hypothetical protein